MARTAAKKKQPEPKNITQSCNESQMQIVLFQGQSSSGTSTVQPEPVRSNQPVEPPITEASESMPMEEDDSSDEDKNDCDIDIEHDPGLRSPISSYAVNDQDSVRRAYIAMGPCQPKMKKEDFPQHECGGMCRFLPSWFQEFKWIEYSVDKDAAFCFVCYLFKDSCRYAGGDAFVDGGFRNWNIKSRIRRHVGAIDSAHNEAEEKYNMFIRPKASIRESVASNTTQYKADYLARLTWSLKCIRFLLRQGLAFRGHDETWDSNNAGNFRELLSWLAGNFEEVNRVVLGNAPQNCQLIDHKIQKQLIASCAHETTKFILKELGDECFAILADESSDGYQQEQLALCLRFVNKKGEPVERFLGLVHVEDTTSLTLKEAIQSLLIKYQLPLSKVRGQGYDGASNMKGHVNGLKKLIMDESPSAYYVHCFAHQLQLTLVAVAKENTDCHWFFGQLAYLLNVLGMSCKKIRMLRVAQAEYMIEALKLGEIEIGQGQNQEMGLARPGDTRWGSHYRTVMHVMALYPSIRKVLFKIGNESNGAEANGAQTMLTVFKSFEFVFLLHLMNEIFGYTNDLCNALQKREQDIVNAMDLLEFTKVELKVLREDDGWEKFLKKVTSFCERHKVKVVDMNGKYVPMQRSKQFYRGAINYHRFHADMYLGIIDRQVQELHNRFDEVNTELLRCMASFNPANSFHAFNVENLVKLARFYPHDFEFEEINQLSFQLNRYIDDVRKDGKFKNLRSLAELSMMLVKTDKISRYDIVYKLLKLVLVLPVATAGVERVFSIMNLIKNKRRSKMGQNYLNGCLVTFIEREFFLQANDGDIISYFQNMKDRRVIL
jgi:hypothetical protein